MYIVYVTVAAIASIIDIFTVGFAGASISIAVIDMLLRDPVNT